MSQTADAAVGYQRGSSWGPDGRYYPSTEERKTPLTEFAMRLMAYLYEALQQVFQGRDDVHVGADQFIYYDPEDLDRKVAPDGYVSFGVPQDPPRQVIRLWEEGRLVLVTEVSSQWSRAEDRGEKLALYRDVLRVPEYLLIDEPTREILLYQLSGGRYVPQKPDARGWFRSQELGVWFGPEEQIGLRVYSPEMEPIPWSRELFKHVESVTRQRDLERSRAEEGQRLAEEQRQRIEALEAEPRRLRDSGQGGKS